MTKCDACLTIHEPGKNPLCDDGVKQGSGRDITIPMYVYDELVRDQKELRALDAAGVDNWEGYEYAMDILREDED